MNQYDVSEQSYKNGFNKGFTSGEYEGIRKTLMFLETQMADTETCGCGHYTMSRFYKYCPYCGKKYT